MYAIEIHTQEAIFHGDLDALRTAFEQYSREDDSVFSWRAPYAIVSILAMFDEAIYPIHPTETVVEQSGWASALLVDMLHIPRIHELVLPEMVDELSELDEVFSFSPQALTPIGALLTVANVEATALDTASHTWCRRATTRSPTST